jgi:thermostable 8-oxoguanine DNA glycosylase
MREVSQEGTLDAKVQRLLSIPGIGIPIASAILAVCYPEQFTILDRRVWETLKEASVEGLTPGFPQDAAGYLQYCQACSHNADKARLSLRDLDRALWAKNWEKDLRSMINESMNLR